MGKYSATGATSLRPAKKNLQNVKIVINISVLTIALHYSCDCTRSALGPPLSSVPLLLQAGAHLKKPAKCDENAVFRNLTARKTPE
jgi:hypothetical protein